MRANRKSAAALLIIAGAILATVLLISRSTASDGSERNRYEVSVQFGTEATQRDMDEVADFLRTFDDDLDFLILEIFPPIGRAIVAADEPAFCETVEAELGARSYVNDVTCGPPAETGQGDPDAPVTSDEGPY